MISSRTSNGSVCPKNVGRRFTLSTANVQGIANDLIVRPFQWKGSVAFIRAFNRDAAHNELGLQGVELVGDDVDGDGDGVANELTVGDLTALSVYLGAQPRPVTREELAGLGLIPPLAPNEITAISHGAEKFADAQCDSCHRPQLELRDAVFTEPSQHPAYRDARFPGGQDPLTLGLDPRTPIEFDLTQDIPDNRIDVAGQTVAFGNHLSNGAGGAIVMLYSDLKRHDMGARLAENIDEVGSGRSVFLTENLWGVGSTAPYLHDGRATTLTEAILEHGGEAFVSRNKFAAMTTTDQSDLIAFLNDLVLFKQ